MLLEAPLEELRRRCNGERKVRPLAQEQAKFEELFAARRADYGLAQLKVQTLDKPVKQIAAEIERLLKAAESGGRKVKAVKLVILLSAVLATSVCLNAADKTKEKEKPAPRWRIPAALAFL